MATSADHDSMTLSRKAGLWTDAARRFSRNRLSVAALVLIILLLVMAVFAPSLAPYDYLQPNYSISRQPPSRAHLMGTDELGRDYLSRIIYGSRVSMAIGLGVQLLSSLIGVSLGALAGMIGGKVDYLIMRIVDIVYALPGLLLTILIMVVLGSGFMNVFLALTVHSWIGICRLTRGTILSLREKEFVEAARAVGASRMHIIRKHLIPNCLSPLIVTFTLGVPATIFGEAGLSFMGIGINPPEPSWGQMVGLYYRGMQAYWHLALFPALMIAISTLAFVLVGDGLRDALDPTSTVGLRK